MLKDLIYLAGFYLNLTDVTDYLTAIDGDEDVSDLTEPKEMETLISLSNLVIRNVTRKYIPLYFEEVKQSNENCEINFSNFSKSVNEIKSVISSDGLKATFRVFPEYIKVGNPNSSYKIVYSYIPSEIRTLNSSLVLPVGISEDDLVFGVCSEFATMNMLYDEADMFESKFKECLLKSLMGKSERKFKSRSFI